LHFLKNLELADYVDHMHDENDELRKMMGWLSRHEPQVTLAQYSTSMTKRFGHGTCKFGHGTLFYDQLMTKLN
jgi:hypothetical protein